MSVKNIFFIGSLAVLSFLPSMGFPGEKTVNALEVVKAKLKVLRPDLPVTKIYESPVSGIVGVDLAGGSTLYATEDGRYMIAGDLYALGSDIINETERHRSKIRKALIAREPLENMIVFSPDGPMKTYVNVFTDIDCGYCQKLHSQMSEYNSLGIEVRYLAYPREGLDGEIYKKSVSAWCSTDPKGALTALKLSREIPMKQCENPVASHYAIGQEIGIKGTPAIVTASGKMLPGYLPPERLAEELGL